MNVPKKDYSSTELGEKNVRNRQALPNVKQEIKLPSEEEVVEASQENIRRTSWTRDIQVTQEEDGGATISFDPEAVNQPGTNAHFDNLADSITRRSFRQTRF